MIPDFIVQYYGKLYTFNSMVGNITSVKSLSTLVRLDCKTQKVDDSFLVDKSRQHPFSCSEALEGKLPVIMRQCQRFQDDFEPLYSKVFSPLSSPFFGTSDWPIVTVASTSRLECCEAMAPCGLL